jgi:hypothetical protein
VLCSLTKRLLLTCDCGQRVNQIRWHLTQQAYSVRQRVVQHPLIPEVRSIALFDTTAWKPNLPAALNVNTTVSRTPSNVCRPVVERLSGVVGVLEVDVISPSRPHSWPARVSVLGHELVVERRLIKVQHANTGPFTEYAGLRRRHTVGVACPVLPTLVRFSLHFFFPLLVYDQLASMRDEL